MPREPRKKSFTTENTESTEKSRTWILINPEPPSSVLSVISVVNRLLPAGKRAYFFFAPFFTTTSDPMIAACAAASRAIGTRNGEQLT